MAGLRSDSLERIVPDELEAADATGGETLELHLQRYEFAAARLGAGRVLDLACGVGYGTRLLADRNPGRVRVLGVDREPEAVAYAKQRYAGADTQFEVGDAMRFVPAEGFAAIVSLETVEHLPHPVEAVLEMMRVARKAVLVSTCECTSSPSAQKPVPSDSSFQ